MIKGRKYRNCRLVSILMCIPCVTPCIALGIPFGIWGLVALNRFGVKEAFES